MISDLKAYPAMKESGVEWLGEVPKHWGVLPNRALFNEIKDKDHPDEDMLSVTIKRGVIRQALLLADTSKKDSSNLDRSNYKLVQPGDVAYNKMRAWQGAIGVSTHRGIVSPAYIVQRPRDDSHSSYFHYLFRIPSFAKEAERWSYGITSDMWSLRPEHFKLIYSCLPPLSEQAAIVRYLDHVDRRVRQLVRAKRKLIALLTEQKQAIIHRAVTRGLDPDVPLKDSGVEWLGEVPAHWEVKRLKWVTRLQRGYDLPADKRIPGPFAVVSSGGVIGRHAERRATAPGVVMGRYGSTDAVFYVEQDFWPHNTSLFVTHFQGNLPKWCYHLLRSISKADHAGKSAVPGVDRKDLFQIVVAVPPSEEQSAIVKAIDFGARELDEAIVTAQREIELLDEYRTRLGSDVVTGKLDVREAASALPAVDPLDKEHDVDANLETQAEGELDDVNTILRNPEV